MGAYLSTKVACLLKLSSELLGHLADFSLSTGFHTSSFGPITVWV